jgi:hypothetical protein
MCYIVSALLFAASLYMPMLNIVETSLTFHRALPKAMLTEVPSEEIYLVVLVTAWFYISMDTPRA